MKILKYAKQNIFWLIVGLIVGSVSVYAGTLMNSNEVEFKPKNNKWNVTKVDEALNSLYSVAVPEEYSGTTSVTPTYSDVTLNTQDKLVKNNITISGIPSTYKNLTSTTTITAGDLVTGKTAYNSDGNLITGTALIDGDCKYGLTTFTTECTTSTGCLLFEGFNPNKFIITLKASNNTVYIYYYNSVKDKDNFYVYNSSLGAKGAILSSNWEIKNNKFYTKNGGTTFVNQELEYIVCK